MTIVGVSAGIGFGMGSGKVACSGICLLAKAVATTVAPAGIIADRPVPFGTPSGSAGLEVRDMHVAQMHPAPERGGRYQCASDAGPQCTDRRPSAAVRTGDPVCDGGADRGHRRGDRQPPRHPRDPVGLCRAARAELTIAASQTVPLRAAFVFGWPNLATAPPPPAPTPGCWRGSAWFRVHGRSPQSRRRWPISCPMRRPPCWHRLTARLAPDGVARSRHI